MNNREIKDILIKELGINGLPKEAQEEISGKLSEIILRALTVSIFEKLSSEAREEFEAIGSTNDDALIQEFLERNVPDIHALMEEETRKILRNYGESTQSATL